MNTGTTLKVEYGYADGSDNTIRPTSLTYPDGRMLDYRYDDEAADELSRIRTLRWDGTDVCRYGYLGLNSYVQVEYPEPAVQYNLATGSGVDPYAGLDRFGRIVDLIWEPTASPSGSSSSSSSSSSGGPSGLAHLRTVTTAPATARIGRTWWRPATARTSTSFTSTTGCIG